MQVEIENSTTDLHILVTYLIYLLSYLTILLLLQNKPRKNMYVETQRTMTGVQTITAHFL